MSWLDEVMGTKTRRMAIALAASGAVVPGLHKFYLRQWRWGLLYLLLWPTHIPQVASIIEAVWYGLLAQDEFDHNFNAESTTRKGDAIPAVSASAPQSASQAVVTAEATDPPNGPPSIDVNRATLADWMQLPAMTEDQGRSLVTLRQAGVQLHCLEDLAAALSVPLETVQGWEPWLKFCYYDPSEISSGSSAKVSLFSPQPVDPNSATIAALTAIPGLDVALALQIIHHRTPPYRNLADLQQRLALSAPQVEHLMHYLQFSNP